MDPEIQERIQALREAIAAIDAEVDQHSLSIRKLHAKKTRLALELRNVKAMVTLARKLPEELYRKIFHMCLSEGSHAKTAAASPLSLSHVCASWRTAALESPLLWSTIDITPFTRSELIKHHIVLSVACPLRLIISTANDEALLLALSQVERWRSVVIATERAFEADAILAALTRPAPNLHSLGVQIWGEEEIGTAGELEHLKTAFPESPKLKRLWFSSHLLPHPSIFPDYITELELVDSASLELSDLVLEIFGNRVLGILERLPLLEFFSLESKFPGPGTTRQLTLHHLTQLTLTALPALCAEALNHLVTPALEALSIRNTTVDALRPTASEDEYRTALRRFLSQRHANVSDEGEVVAESMPLRKLHIHNASLPSGTLVHLPQLQMLQLHDSDIEDITLNELRKHDPARLKLEDLDLRWEGRVSGSAILRLLKDSGTSYSVTHSQRGVKRATLLHCSHVQEETVIEVAKLTTCRLVAEEGDYCYPEGCCKNTRYRQRMRLLYRNSLSSEAGWNRHLVL